MDYTLLPPLAIFAVAACFTPGPNNFMLMSSGAIFGFRKTIPHIIGVQFGFMTLMAASVFGLGIVVGQLPWLVTIVKLIGAAWLLWLAWSFFKTAMQSVGSVKTDDAPTQARPFKFHEAAFFQWANPKALIMSLSAAGAYIALADTALVRALVICSVFIFFGSISSSLWTFAGNTLNKYMSGGRSAQILNGFMGLLLVATAIMIVLAKGNV